MKALTDAAHHHGLLAIVHALDRAAAQSAVEAGADGLADLVVDAVPEPGFAPAEPSPSEASPGSETT